MKFSSVMFMSIIVLILSTVMMVSCNSWLSLWVCLELNMFMFIPVIMWSTSDYEEEGAVKYFIIQSLASAMLVISIFYSYNLSDLEVMVTFFLAMAIFMKMGSFPFIFWYTSVMKSISWISCMILSTWQKLGPLLILIFFINSLNKLFMFVSLINVLIGGCAGCMQPDLRALIANSSISHLGWMLSILSGVYQIWSIIYFIMSTLLVFPSFFILMMMNVKKLSSLLLSKVPLSYSLSLMLLLLSLGGVPPMSGFLPKLMILNILVYENLLMGVLMVIFSLMSLYMYMNMFFTMFIFYYMNLELKLEFELCNIDVYFNFFLFITYSNN
uniref:NADH-ubiquinone oxidoreductase chain 2 n=1 Tax=Whitmania laevis TaxID=307844 RepID=X2CBT4_WHILA|nr:NADH dehydrogenase subunit 2 [Whitmania laevis]AGL34600.1 NADH dehydrogenase subunit 2 [Whitmania laevis]